jgi:hypothetical protein
MTKDNYISPHLEFGLSREKNNNTSQIANLPVTITKESRHNNSKESEGIENEDSSYLKVIMQNKNNLR